MLGFAVRRYFLVQHALRNKQFIIAKSDLLMVVVGTAISTLCSFAFIVCKELQVKWKIVKRVD